MSNVFANGFGIFHVQVSRTCASPLLAARKALRAVLEEREPNVDPSCWRNLKRATLYDTDSCVAYCEA